MEDSKQPHPVDIVVGSRVRTARIAAGLSQGALGEQIGLTFQQVQKYENGSNRISASKLVEIADTLGVSAAGFLEGLGRGCADHAPGVDATEGAHDLLSLYARLPPVLRDAVLQLARTLVRGMPSLTARAERRSKPEGSRDRDGRTSAEDLQTSLSA